MIFSTTIRGEPIIAQMILHSGKARKRAPLVSTIQLEVAAYFGLHPDHMKSKCRNMSVSHPRQIAMYLARELTGKSMPDIGHLFGNRHHTTVLHAIRTVEQRVCNSVEFAEHVEALRERLAA